MQKATRIVSILILLLSIVTLISVPAATAASAQNVKPLEIKWITYDKMQPIFDGMVEWMKKVTERSQGAITFRYLGGPEVIPVNEQFAAVSKGIADITITMPGYYGNTVPEANAHNFFKNSTPARRANGMFSLMNSVYAKHNIIYITDQQTQANTDGMFLFLNQKIEKPEDLKGLRIRGSGVNFNKFLQYWGAIPVDIPPAEQYTALDRGMIKGFTTVFQGFFLQSLQEVTKYYIYPGYSRAAMCLYMNLDTWKKISPEMQKMAMDTAAQVEKDWVQKWIDFSEQQYVKAKDVGLQRITFSEQDGKRFKQSYYDTQWADVLTRSPEIGPKIKALSE